MSDRDAAPTLGVYHDLLEAARRQRPEVSERALTPEDVRELLGFAHDAAPGDVRVERRWRRDGIDGEELSWSVGYGPRTQAWLLRPAGAEEALPGVLALHGHDNFRYLGKEKIADGPEGPHPAVRVIRSAMYEGRPFANDLARRGFVVLATDVFCWGSRGFPLESMRPGALPPPEDRWMAVEQFAGDPDEAQRYNLLAAHHEHLVSKYCTVLGASLAGVVSFEDRVAAAVLRSRPGVAGGPLGAVGLSGGGCRAALLQATCEQIGAAVVVGMMSTHRELLERHVANHTWMLFPPALCRVADWPDLAAARAPSPLLVQYNRDDPLFPLAGQQRAHERLEQRYRAAGALEAYVGRFYDGPHKFDAGMQDDAFQQLAHWLT